MRRHGNVAWHARTLWLQLDLRPNRFPRKSRSCRGLRGLTRRHQQRSSCGSDPSASLHALVPLGHVLCAGRASHNRQQRMAKETQVGSRTERAVAAIDSKVCASDERRVVAEQETPGHGAHNCVDMVVQAASQSRTHVSRNTHTPVMCAAPHRKTHNARVPAARRTEENPHARAQKPHTYTCADT